MSHHYVDAQPSLRPCLFPSFCFVLSTVLAQNRYFDDPAFLRYLRYLQYWRRPEYACFLTHPTCLYFLAALGHPRFRAAIGHDDFMALVHSQQGYAWQFGASLTPKDEARAFDSGPPIGEGGAPMGGAPGTAPPQG